MKKNVSFGLFGSVLLVCSSLLISDPAAAQVFGPKSPHVENQPIVIEGVVIDDDGQPLSGVRVVFEAWRKAFDYRSMRRKKFTPRTVETRSHLDGTFRLEWPWHDYFNRFELRAEVDVRKPEREIVVERLATSELSKQVKLESQIEHNLVVDNAEFYRGLRAFEAAVSSTDHRAVYEENGVPDKVEAQDVDGDIEEAWWYFPIGKVVRFRNGVVDSTESFDPVTSFDDR